MKKILLFGALSANLLTGYAQTPAYVPTDSLQGWWPFTGNADDQSIHARNGVVSGATLTTDRNGSTNAAYLFNGTSNKITVAPLGTLNLTHTTVSAWVKYTGDAESTKIYDTYFQLGSYPDNSLGYSYEYTTGKLNLYRKCKGTQFQSAAIADSWHHVVIVQDSLKSLIYVDATLVGTTSSLAPTCASSVMSLLFGASPDDAQWMTGSLDDIGFWTRVLTPCEITALYEAAPQAVYTAQPVDTSGYIGETVSFGVTATAASYQWQSNIGPGNSFIDLPSTGQYSGVTTDTLTVSALTAANNNQLFRCIIANENNTCETVSDIVSISINTTGIDNLGYLKGSDLYQNYPNPTHNTTVIAYNVVAIKQEALLSVYDVTGRLVRNYPLSKAGKGTVNINTEQLEKGTYFYTLVVDGITVGYKKMVVLN